MLLIILKVYISKYLLCFAADDLDGSGLQLEKIGQFFQVLPGYFGEIASN